MQIIGVACHCRDSAACLLGAGESFAVREDNFGPAARADGFPLQAFNFCLQAGGITAQELDYAVFHEKPFLRFAKTLAGHIAAWPESSKEFIGQMPAWLEQRLGLPYYLRRETGFAGTPLFVRHHAAHAAAAFYQSPFERAAVLVADSGRESDAVSLCSGGQSGLVFHRTSRGPHSPATLLCAGAAFLGFGERELGHLSAAAAFGSPLYEKQLLESVLRVREDGSAELNRVYFNCTAAGAAFSEQITSILGQPPALGEELAQRHFDVAASLQGAAAAAAVACAKAAAAFSQDSGNLCLGGGLFANPYVCSRVQAEAGFKNVFIPSLPGNAGAAAGAASYALHDLLGQPRSAAREQEFTGPSYPAQVMRRALINGGLDYKELPPEELAFWLGERLACGKIAGWFQGPAEFSRHPLFSRAVLSAPFTTAARQQFNSRAKRSRPFQLRATVVLAEKACEYFDWNGRQGALCQTKREKLQAMPAVTGPDGQACVFAADPDSQPLYGAMLRAFEKRTGVPVLLASAMNFSGRPCVMSPADAVDYFKASGLDCLALGPFVVEKNA